MEEVKHEEQAEEPATVEMEVDDSLEEEVTLETMNAPTENGVGSGSPPLLISNKKNSSKVSEPNNTLTSVKFK